MQLVAQSVHGLPGSKQVRSHTANKYNSDHIRASTRDVLMEGGLGCSSGQTVHALRFLFAWAGCGDNVVILLLGCISDDLVDLSCSNCSACEVEWRKLACGTNTGSSLLTRMYVAITAFHSRCYE